jgi:hypothetical protein
MPKHISKYRNEQNPMDIKFLRSTAGKTRREKRLETFHPLTQN